MKTGVLHLLVAGTLAMLWAGCGGGGGGGGTPAGYPSITAQPQSQTVAVGAQASFSVVATGTPTPSYQWYQGSTAISTGGTAATYTTPATTLAMSGENFSVAVSNSDGSVTSAAAALTVEPAAFTVTFTAGPGGTLSGTLSQPSLSAGTCTPVAASPDPGHLFTDWTGTGGFTTTASNPLTVTDVTANMAITAHFVVGARVDTSSFPIDPNHTNLYSLPSPVPLAATAPTSTLTITFANPAPNPGGGSILINTETFSFAPFVLVPAGATSLTIHNAAPNTAWFGVGLATGTTYADAQIANSSASASSWNPGLVTFEWQ
jgi:hypothetical protein